MERNIIKKQKYSYSKINTYDSCGWKYFLTYKEGHYLFTDSLAASFGSLVHWVEQNIGETIKAGEQVNYEKLKEDFLNINIPKTSKFDVNGGIFGVNILKQRYTEEYFKTNELGQSYATRAQDYLDRGIYRLENWLKANPDYEIFGLEQFFSITFNGEILSGFIDRIFHNKADDSYIIEDIKTKDKPFKDEELTTPLQFVIYNLALQNILDNENIVITCAYDLPFCNLKQDAGTKGFMKRGTEKLKKLFDGINHEEFIPAPSPLCAWCSFSPTNPNQPEGGKGLCPYYSLWTPSHKTFAVANAWEGMNKHKEILQRELNKEILNTELGIDFDF